MTVTHPENVIPELMTLDQAAALCNVSPRTLWGWAHDGSAPPPVKIGKGTVRYVRSVYLAWCAGGCQPIQGGASDGK
jgi:predicted DNA-binding transcriptional regulator AlpA